MIPKPKFVYPLGTDLVPSSRLRGSPVRTIHHHGRSGINFTSIRGRVVLPGHTLNEPQGSAVLWVMPLDDLFPAAQYPQHKVSNRHSDKFVFLTDREAVREVDGAFFTLCYHSYWHPVFYAKFFTGAMATGVWAIRPKACAMAGHFEFHRLSWYCLTLTWNHASGHYRIYANGVLVAAEDATAPVPFAHDPCGRILYAGNPALVLSDFTFYDHEFSPEDVRKIFETNSTHRYPQIEQGLERHWGGKNLRAFQPPKGPGWETSLDLPLTRAEDVEAFFHQGGTPTLETTAEGLHVRTPSLEEFIRTKNMHAETTHTDIASTFDMTRMYLWSHGVFAGDLHISFDFRLNAHGGLALLMTQAAGMQGEDFLEDYFLRADGRMTTVCWEDVRNYHWEFYREMCDVRNDLVSHAMLKNPWYKPMAFQVENRNWELGRWYHCEYLQEGPDIRTAIDGIQVIETTDTGFDNNGPVLNHGRIALRCMMRTDMVFRNLVVRTRTQFDRAE